MIKFILNHLEFIFGFIAGQIAFFISECFCIVADKSELDKWTYTNTDVDTSNSHVDED